MTIRTILLAPPGAGKGTQAKKISEATGALHISTGDALRSAVANETPVGLQAKKYMDAGKLVPDQIVLGIVQESLESASESGWILDGFPRNGQQAISLDEILENLGQQKYCVIYFEVSNEILIERIAGRYKDLKRSDDDPDVALNRLEVYKEETASLIEFYRLRESLKAVDGCRSVDDIFNEVMTYLIDFFRL